MHPAPHARRTHTVLVACSHGTANPRGTAAVASLAAAVGARVRGPVVEAFVDVHGPYVADVVADHAEGADVVVVPLLLAAGFHVHVDIRKAVAGHPSVRVTGALGPDPRLTSLLLDRLDEVGATADDTVVLAAAGSSDERADASVRVAARDLGRAWGAPVTVGYGAARNPRVPAEVARLRDQLPGRRIVLASYLLAPGHFHDRLAQAGADLVTAPLVSQDGPDPRLVDLVVERFRCAGTASCEAALLGPGRTLCACTS